MKAELRLNAYAVISRAVEEGVLAGWNRGHRHTDTPDPQLVMDCIHDEVMAALTEVVVWPEKGEET